MVVRRLPLARPERRPTGITNPSLSNSEVCEGTEEDDRPSVCVRWRRSRCEEASGFAAVVCIGAEDDVTTTAVVDADDDEAVVVKVDDEIGAATREAALAESEAVEEGEAGIAEEAESATVVF